MKLFRSSIVYMAIVVLLVSYLQFGCSKDKPINPIIDPVSLANDSLGRQMNHLIEETLDNPDSSFRPRDVDLSGVNSLYEQALAADPANTTAKFGSAFTGLMIFLADPDLNRLVDEFKNTYDTLTFNPFRPAKLLPQIEGGSPQMPDRMPTKLHGLRGVLPALMTLDQAVMATAASDPKISDIQNVLEEQLLPKVERSRNLMIDVCSQPSYTFTITPLMQGDNGASPIILDRSDFQVMLATLYAAEAGLHVFFARDLDLASYTAAAAQDAMSQSSSFLSLKSNSVGAVHMTNAKGALLSAEAELETAIDYLLAEIETDQSEDLIQVYPDDADNLVEMKDSLSYYRTYFDSPKELNVYWLDANFSMTVDISRFFDAPMENPKAFLPAYSVTVEELHNAYRQFVSEHFSRDRYWAALDTIFGISYPNDAARFGYHLPDQDNNEFYRLLGDWNTNGQFVFGWDDVQNSCANHATDLYCYWSNHVWDYMNQYRSHPDQVRICYTWQASSLSSWTWPDPTFNGLFPGMTSNRLKEILVDNGFNWERSQCYETDLDY